MGVSELPRIPRQAATRPPPFDGYARASGTARAETERLVHVFNRRGPEGLAALQREAEISLLNQGITFTVYADERGTEKILPFDVVPRVISGIEWAALESGIEQRLRAIQRFLADLYGEQRILRDGVIPSDLVVNSPFFCREMVGVAPRGDVWVNIAGVDLIQDETGGFMVLEDNLRVPSGVSYVLENRRVMGRILPDVLQRARVRSVEHYPQMLFDALRSMGGSEDCRVAVLTPGIYNSAYFEHSFLAAEMGVDLVEGQDLLVDQDVLYAKTISGLERIDVLYRRVDDDFLDPLVFRSDSLLGVPGIMHAVRAGNLSLANAPGTGVVDDKAMYAYLPRVIEYYLGEKPQLAQVPTYLCREEKSRATVLANLGDLVVKPTDGSGGYGILIGPHASDEEIARMRADIEARPERFVAQPLISLSTLPTIVSDDGDAHLEPRHVDLRPFAVTGADGAMRLLPGGLTRVALRKGTVVVNSSQGGGTKDTWVLHDGEDFMNAE